MTLFLVVEALVLVGVTKTTGFDGKSWMDWAAILLPFAGAPTVSAILISPGFRARHAIAALASLLVSALVLLKCLDRGAGGNSEVFLAFLIFCGAMTMVQTAWLRWLNVPRWIVRPSTRRQRQGVSLKWLLAITGLIALGFVGLRSLEEPQGMIEMVLMMGPAMVAVGLANVLAGMSRRSRRYGLLLGCIFILSIVYIGTKMQRFPAPEMFLPPVWVEAISQRMLPESLFVAPAASLTIVLLVHRIFRRFNRRATAEPTTCRI